MKNSINETLPLNLYEIFSSVNVGILIMNMNTTEILFINRYLKHISLNSEQRIVDEMLSRYQSGNLNNGANVIDCIDEVTLGFSTYNLNCGIYIVFFKDISSKIISSKNREDNQFYDRLTGMIAEIAHEIGNPLTSVMTTLEVIRDNIDEWEIEKSRSYLKQALNELNRLHSYLKKIRDFTKTRNIEIACVDLKKLINRIYLNNRSRLMNSRISFIENIAEDIIVRADEDILYHILLNFLYNSLESMQSEGRIHIDVDRSAETFIKLIYMNDGPEISSENYRKIFLPFFSTKNSGLGIGLAVSLKYMTRMGGTIEIEKPPPGWGVKFVLHIPAVHFYGKG